jgi:hypothetical protein
MANVTPGYTFTGTTDPITYTKLNLLGQPTVSIGYDEVTSSMIASSVTLESPSVTSGLTVTTGGLTVTAGGLTVTAGGATVTAGGLTVTAGGLTVSANGASVAGGLTVSTGGATISAGGITLGASTPINMAATTETFGATIALSFDATKGNTRIINCTSNTAATINVATVPAAGYILIIRFSTDGTASNAITFGTNFKDTGNYALNSANHWYTATFVSDGTYLVEVCRSGAAA